MSGLIKTSSLTAISTVIKLASSFLAGKLIAVYTGPSGIALLGNFSNFITMVSTFANGGINSGIVKYVAEYEGKPQETTYILSTAFLLSLFCSLLMAVGIIFFSHDLSTLFLRNRTYSPIVSAFGISLVFLSVNSFLVSVLNGYRETKSYVVVNIASSLVSLLFTCYLTYGFGLYGALLSLATSQSVIIVVTLFFVLRKHWFNLKLFFSGIHWESAKKLGHYTLMMLTSALVVPISQIVVRNHLADHLSLDAAGYWQAVTKISDAYLLIVTTSLSVYYLPKLSQTTNNRELQKVLFDGIKVIVPFVTLSALAIYLSRHFIISLLYSYKFMAMGSLFAYQLLGDVIKIASWLLGFIMVAKAKTAMFVITEIVFAALFVGLVFILVDHNGIIGVTQAFALNYFLYLLLMLWLFKGILFIRPLPEEVTS